MLYYYYSISKWRIYSYDFTIEEVNQFVLFKTSVDNDIIMTIL